MMNATGAFFCSVYVGMWLRLERQQPRTFSASSPPVLRLLFAYASVTGA